MRVSLKRCERSSRAGFSLLEMFVAGILLAALLSALGPTIYWIQRAQRTSEEKHFAILELANQMEQVFAQRTPLTEESLGKLNLSAFSQNLLPDAVLTSELTGSGVERKVKLSLAWTDSAGQTVHPTHLVAWLPEKTTAPSNETAGLPVKLGGSL